MYLGEMRLRMPSRLFNWTASSASSALPAKLACAGCLFLVGLQTITAWAQDKGPDENGITSPSIATSLPPNGDPTGARKWLAGHGVTYNLIYTNDVLANVHGGLRRGVIDQGKLEYNMTLDVEKLAGWQGLSFYTNAFQIHNTGRIRRDYVGGINTIAAIEAVPATRLSELWLEQKFWNGAASIRFGQLAADIEFFFSGLSFMFLQSDWATITAANLPSGGPAYPLSTPGVRLKIDPTPETSLLFAVFNGDPAGPGEGDEQLRNRYGLNFRVRDPAFVMTEAQVRANQGKMDTGLARTLKLGAWGHLGTFDDQRYADDGTLLADPAGSGEPLKRRGNFGIYGVIEQQIFRPKGGDAESGISVFSRISASPSDRNPIDFYVDGGIVFAGMIPRRPDDKFGASAMYARFSDGVRASDRDWIALSGIPGVVRDFEANLELTYQAQIIPGWTVQPVVTFIWHPSGDASRNATITGVRSIWLF
jgi:porin